VIAILVGIRLMFNRASWKLGDDLPTGAKRFGVGALIGFLSTLMGIGGGVLNNTFMTLFNRPIHQAVATSAGVGVLISVPGFIGSIWAGWGEAGLPFLVDRLCQLACRGADHPDHAAGRSARREAGAPAGEASAGNRLRHFHVHRRRRFFYSVLG
jgi:hypothetical protein